MDALRRISSEKNVELINAPRAYSVGVISQRVNQDILKAFITIKETSKYNYDDVI